MYFDTNKTKYMRKDRHIAVNLKTKMLTIFYVCLLATNALSVGLLLQPVVHLSERLMHVLRARDILVRLLANYFLAP